MTAYHEVFIRTGNPEAVVVADVGDAAGASLAPVAPINEATSYRAIAGREIVELETAHEFEQDGDMPFDRYPLIVTIRDLDANKQRESEAAQAIYDSLTAKGYDAMLVFDLQKLIARTAV